MDLRSVLIEIHTALDAAGIGHALIGGLALAVHGAGRATIDLDLLAEGSRDGEIDALVRGRGYECLYRTENVANYLSADPARGRIDFLFVRRVYGLAILERATEYRVLDQAIRVVDASDLIGLKVQSSTNNPARAMRDMADIERLLASAAIDLERVRLYFRLFEREAELEALLAKRDAR